MHSVVESVTKQNTVVFMRTHISCVKIFRVSTARGRGDEDVGGNLKIASELDQLLNNFSKSK